MKSCKTFQKMSKLYHTCSLFDTILPPGLSPRFSDLHHHSVFSFMARFCFLQQFCRLNVLHLFLYVPFCERENLPSFCCHEQLPPHRLLNPSEIRWSARHRLTCTSSGESRPSRSFFSELSTIQWPSQQQLFIFNQCNMAERFYKRFYFYFCVCTHTCVCSWTPCVYWSL